MKRTPDLVVFSDLDGTLLDHGGYSWAPAAQALGRLRRMGAGLVLATSKTAAEVAPLREAIGFHDWPAIVENGGGILEPGDVAARSPGTYPEIRGTLESLPLGFRGFGDMTVEEVAQATGLPLQDAAKAKDRQFSEPGLWTGSDSAFEAFRRDAEAAGLSVQRGGRFIALSFGGTKADRVEELIRRFAPLHSVALGDAPNDKAMLERADRGFIIRNASGPGVPRLPGEKTGRIRRTTQEGPLGWAEAIGTLLDELSATGNLNG